MEIWRKIKYKNFSHFDVSNMGRIRSTDRVLHRKDGKKQNIKGRILKARTNNIEPHYFCELQCTVSGTILRKTVYVHKTVMEHFGKPPIKRKNKFQQYVEHIDGDYDNNHIDNLRWITWEQLYVKQMKNGRVECMDLYKHSSVWQKSQNKNIKVEMSEFPLPSNEREECIFCGKPTNYWHMKTNKPVCQGCAKIKLVVDIKSHEY